MNTPSFATLGALASGLVLTFLAGARSQLGESAPQVPDVLRARRIELVDAEGRPRAELGIDADGSAGLFVRDVQGGLRACVIHDEGQSALYLFDDAGTLRVGASQFAHGGGGFALHGTDSQGATVLYMKDAQGSLTFYDREGAVLERVAPR